jgi:hypothetical protein
MVRAVLEHWLAAPYHPRPRKITDARRRRVQARLAEGFTVDELCAAIDGAAKDAWLMGTDAKSTKAFRDLDTILRDAAQVERLIELRDAAPRAKLNGHSRPGGVPRQACPDDYVASLCGARLEA